jgi:hypothetical protein
MKTACSAGRPVLVIGLDLGGIAQLVERLVRNEKVRGSNPLTSIYSVSQKFDLLADR